MYYLCTSNTEAGICSQSLKEKCNMSNRTVSTYLLLEILIFAFFWIAAPFALAGQGFEVKLVSVFGGPGSDLGQFKFPLGMIVNSQDQIIIADAENNRIQICDHEGNCEAFGSFGFSAGDFRNPHGVAVDSQDRIYTVETHNNRVQIFDSKGIWISMFGSAGSALGQFRVPGDVAIDNQGRILVADEQNYRVQTCDEAGNCTAFGSQGTAPGEFDWPRAIVVDSADTIIVTDRYNHRVQLCNEQGNCDVFGSPGTEIGQFGGPVEVALDSQERIIIADRDNHRVQVCDRQGDCWAFGSFGSGPGELIRPLGVAVDSQDRIIVADNGNDRIQIFEVISSFQINAGLNDAWFNLATNGQGFLISVFPDIKQMFLAWFTYDTEHPPEDVTAFLGEPGHRWLTAQGPYDGDTANLTIFVTEGGVLDAAEPVAETDPAGDGTMTIEFADCTEGLVKYQITSLGISGEIPIERITPDNVALCETLASP
jgi:DNA-binding beta-propeller fold protein YncE